MGSGGLRKVRWSRSGMGKRGGTRVIYYNTLSEGSIWLLIAYTKTKFDNLGVSQSAFAKLIGVSLRTLQDWEQGRRQPTGAAQTLLRVASQHPEALRDLQAV
ncbi:helix-turn-helix domain-containing protein [Pseudomonas sp. QTF5]|uniref:helix-turn-helix domain-containing protein n=1 Tax=Pseudomonas sp. QTF5 TaxID=1435425 RepID=UPI0009DE817C